MSVACPQTSAIAEHSAARRIHLFRGSVFAAHLGLRLFAMPASLATTLLLSHALGPEQFGGYAYVLAWVTLLTVPATLGFDGFLVREISASHSLQDWGLLRGLLNGPLRAVGLASLAICALGIGVTLIVTLVKGEPALATLVMVGFTLVPLIAMRQIYRSAMQGIQRPLLGFVPELFVHPFTMLLLAATATVVMHRPLSALHAICLQVTAGVLSLLVGHLLMKRALPLEILNVPSRTEYRSWLRGATPFLLAQFAFLANEKLSLLALGLTAELSQVGIFAIVSSLAMLVSLPLITVNSFLAGRVAHLYAAGKKLELQQLLISVELLCVLATLPVVVVECLFGEQLLGMFGAEFTSGYTALRILALAQFFNAAAGSVGVVLNMSGHARDVVAGTVISTALGLACCIFLIPHFGIAGAAVAQGVGVVVFNSLLVIKAHQRLGINPTIFALFRRKAAL